MLTFRTLKDEDELLIEQWLQNAHVKKWYAIPQLGVTLDDWMDEIKKRHTDFNWLTHLMVLWQDKPIGMCQYYKCVDSDEDFKTLPIEGTYGIDYLIGEVSYIGKGLGTCMIKALVDTIFTFPDARRITADIDENNKASERSLLASGFVLFDKVSSRYVIHKPSQSVHTLNLHI